MENDSFRLDRYEMVRKFFAIGKKYNIKDEYGNDLFYASMEMLKLRPKIHIYDNDRQTGEILTITPNSILDYDATYEITDARTQALIGSIKRDGLHSLFQNRWNIMDASGNVVGYATEPGLAAIVRRFILNWKLDFDIECQGRRIGRLNKKMALRDRYVLDLSGDRERMLDRRLAIAMLPLLDAGEHR